MAAMSGVFLFASCRSVDSAGAEAMHVMIYDYDNNGVAGVEVYVDGRSVGRSDARGRIAVPVTDAGEHELVFEKGGYESVRGRTALDARLVLYYKMWSAEQLVRQAEAALDGGDAESACGLLERAQAIGAGAEARYLLSVALMKQGRTEEAREQLSCMERTAGRAAYIAGLERRLSEHGADGVQEGKDE